MSQTREADASRAQQFGRHLANLHSVRLVKERVIMGRLESLVGRAPDAAAERVLATIVNTAGTQRMELEDILLAWRRQLTRGPSREPGLERLAPIDFHEVVESLVRVLRQSAAMYQAAARDCPNPALAERLGRLADEDLEHALILEEIVERS